MNTEHFLHAIGELAASLGWQLRSFTRGQEQVAVVALDHDPSFEQVLWVHDAGQASVRCLLVCRGKVPSEREAAILELCARINEDLLFGCAEYGFDDRTVAFRDSMQLSYGPIAGLVASTTQRLLQLGSQYAPAVRAALAGSSAVEAMKCARDAHE